MGARLGDDGGGQAGERAEMRLGLTGIVQQAQRDEAGEKLLVAAVGGRGRLDEVGQIIGMGGVAVRQQGANEMGGFGPQRMLLHGQSGGHGGIAAAHPEGIGIGIAAIAAQEPRRRKEQARILLTRDRQRGQQGHAIRIVGVERRPDLGRGLIGGAETRDLGVRRR